MEINLSDKTWRRIRGRVIELHRLYGIGKTPSEIVEIAVAKYLDQKRAHSWYRAVARTRKYSLKKEQRGLCFYCHRKPKKHRATIDHRIPIGRGGKPYDRENMVYACSPCNAAKGMMTVEEFELSKRLSTPTPSRPVKEDEKMVK